MPQPLTLFSDAFSISPYAMSCFVALEEKGLAYQLVKVGLHAGEHKLPSYKARTGRVPALQHGDFVLAESSAIAEYLEDAFPGPSHPRLFPEAVRERAIAREVMAWIRSDLMPLREERPTTSVFIQSVSRPLSEHARHCVRRLVAACEALIKPGQPTLFAHWCLADTDLALMLQRLASNGDELPRHLADYAAAQWKRPSVARWLAQPRSDYTPY
ncbi:MAG: glutathione transferase [Myxococcales bacterium]|nr:glutathione transferase [Myxococcales bacterium]